MRLLNMLGYHPKVREVHVERIHKHTTLASSTSQYQWVVNVGPINSIINPINCGPSPLCVFQGSCMSYVPGSRLRRSGISYDTAGTTDGASEA